MILCNLQNILADKRTNISKVSRETGISRTTLTSLCSNTCQGVQLETVNTLCRYLDIGVEQLFLFSKYDLYVRSGLPYLEIEKIPKEELGEIRIIIQYSEQKVECKINADLYIHYEKNYINWIDVELSFQDPDDFTGYKEEITAQNRLLHKMLSELHPAFKTWLRNEIEFVLCNEYDLYVADGYEITIDFPQEFK